jgi:hypothetical protein
MSVGKKNEKVNEKMGRGELQSWSFVATWGWALQSWSFVATVPWAQSSGFVLACRWGRRMRRRMRRWAGVYYKAGAL